jgi:drug/metabolite transporter (DMT)-like permease
VTTLALGIVLVSAIIHATWNLYAKRAGGGAMFVWLINLIACAAYLPFAVATIVLAKPVIGGIQLVFMAGSAVLQLAYFLALLRGYRLGDLSLVYPLARGTGPLIATIGAIVLFGERPSPLALGGMLLVVSGAFVLSASPSAFAGGDRFGALTYGLTTGLLIGAYTLWDRYAVTTLQVPPLLQYYGAGLGQFLLLTPFALGHRSDITQEWRLRLRPLLIVGLLSPISYILVLTAFTLSPVSYVAPTREISILLGAILGTRLLAEGDARRRLIASGAMVAGVMALALG